MKIILIGPPGAGKGTQAEYLCNELKIPAISTGNILRQYISNNHPLGLKAKKYMDDGELIPDHLILDIIDNRLCKNDCLNGYILDGFPRSLNQCNSLFNKNILIDLVFEFILSEQEIITRISGRRVHAESGRTYHIVYNPPKKQDIDDITNEPLIQRDDDKTETIIKRISVFNKQTKPVVDFLKDKLINDYHIIDSSINPLEINKKLLDIIEKKRQS